MAKKALVLSVLVALSSAVITAEACTTTIITKGASADGNTYVTHSNDTYSSDPSIVYVPAKNHKAGSMRPVYPSAVAWDDYPELDCYAVPRLVAPERSRDYDVKDKPATQPLGYIPEVKHTYAYLDSDYAIMNEKGLMLGECTNNGASCEYLAPVKGKNLFYSSELGRVALERCATAREAVELMGSLIDEYGIWGTGETLLVADKNEGWVLEMQPDEKGKGFWIAQRVPDGEVFVTSNLFRIRDIRPDSEDQIFNPQLPEQLKAAGLAVTNPESGRLDWAASIKTVEDFHPYFTLRRIWRADQLIAPSVPLPSKVEGPVTRAYPFSMRPDKPLTLNDIKALHRDIMENTEFDKTKVPDAGLFQSPYRYNTKANTERAINHNNTGYTWITQSEGTTAAPLCWISMSTPRENVFIPFTVAQMSESYTKVERRVYDPDKMWWSASRVAELTKGYYSVLAPTVLERAQTLEEKSQELVLQNKDLSASRLDKLLKKNAAENQAAWDSLYGELLVKLDQGKGIKYPAELKGDNVEKY